MKEYTYKINGNEYKVAIGEIEDNIAHLKVNGIAYEVEMEKKEEEVPVVVKPIARPAAQEAPADAPAAKPVAGGTGIKSPLPGVIIDIKVAVGDAVTKGQVVAVLEAMKMENNITADRDGKVTAICAQAGESVMEGTDIVMIG